MAAPEVRRVVVTSRQTGTVRCRTAGARPASPPAAAGRELAGCCSVRAAADRPRRRQQEDSIPAQRPPASCHNAMQAQEGIRIRTSITLEHSYSSVTLEN
jgi:hypothetical protein